MSALGDSGVPLPDAEARALYLALLARGGVFSIEDLPDGDTGALERLRLAGLVAELSGGLPWTVVDPRAAADRLAAQLRTAGRSLLDRADEPSPVLAELAQAYEQVPQPATEDAIQYLKDPAELQRRLEQLVRAARSEILSALPGNARQLDVAQVNAGALAVHEQGATMRVLYQPGARTTRSNVLYAAYATSLGHRIRTLDEPFRKTLVFDRRVAVVGGHSGDLGASFIEDPVLVAVVVDQFERDWERAERVQWDAPVVDPADPLPALLARGLTQRAIATRLGLSERTVASQISRLRERYDAETLFQLGWQMRADAPGDRGRE